MNLRRSNAPILAVNCSSCVKNVPDLIRGKRRKFGLNFALGSLTLGG